MPVCTPADHSLSLKRKSAIPLKSTAVAAVAAVFTFLIAPALRAQASDSASTTVEASAPVWPVRGPAPLPGALLPAKRIVAYYGNPNSRQMGILGEIPPAQMLARLEGEASAWRSADPATPVQKALHLVTVVAQADKGYDGKYRAKMNDTIIERVHTWAKSANAVMFLDIQVGLSSIQAEVPRLEKFLMRPDVHLGIDPEFAMKNGVAPGKRVGSYDADDINDVIDYLAELVTKHNLPPKVLVIHRFTQRMVTGHDRIKLDPRVQVVMHMDGWGAPRLKRDTYRAYIYKEPVQFAGFKIFYKNDTRRGSTLMKPADLLELTPRPLYIQYQ